MKKFLTEFKEFVAQGNVMDMAIGVIIGAAFKAIIDSLVKDILNPLIALFTGDDLSMLSIKIAGAQLTYGNFISAVINFFIIVLILFIMIKAVAKTKNITTKSEEEASEPTEKECPYCKRMIPIGATRCGYCTTKLKGFQGQE